MPEAPSDGTCSDEPSPNETWRALAEKALKAPIETLVARSTDDIAIQPLYLRRTRSGPRPWREANKREAGAWRVAQRVDHPDPLEANRFALLDLEGGADALTIVVAGTAQSRGFGLAPDPRTLGLVLEAIELDLIAVRLDSGSETLAAAQAMAKLIEDRRLTSASLMLDLGCDPLGEAARSGRASDLSLIARVLDVQQKAALAGRPLLADSRPYHEAGCGPAQELAAVLATATAYLRHLEALGLSLDAAREAIAILLTADADTFFSLAKFRAIRRLWARVETACGLAPKPLRLHAETAWRMMSRIDPWVNAMRATSGIFAAGLGGADVVTALPFTLANGLPDAAARRLARNAQRVLIDEAHLDAVDDPAAGSGAFDSLTDELCTHAWTLFQEIEREGGLAASLAAGMLQGRIAKVARARASALATLQDGLVGTSLFPSLNHISIGVLDVPSRPGPSPSASALPSAREAAPFEMLRDKVNAQTDNAGRPPKIFLATLGSPADRSCAARATNFFAVAGIGVVLGGVGSDFKGYDLEATPIICVCTPEMIDATDVDETIQRARDVGARHVLQFSTGRSVQPISQPTHADIVIHQGCDALHMLASVLRMHGDRADAGA